MSTKALLSVEEFAQMQFADTEDYELVEGELVPLSGGSYRHNMIRDLMGHLLWEYFKTNPVGVAVAENDCLVTPDRVRRPDVSVFLSNRLSRLDLDAVLSPVAPDIAVEVLSPSERIMEVRGKVREYLEAGVSEAWLLDNSNREVQVHTRAGIRVLPETEFLESGLLPGFRVLVAELLRLVG
jgi:Uma2 family endonuclease